MTGRIARTLAAALAVLVVVSFVPGATAKAVKRKRAAPTAPAEPAPSPRVEAAPAESAPGKGIPITVVEVAGTQAYLEPGTKGGVHRGSRVTIGRTEYTVVQATDSFAAILVGESPPRERDKGRAAPLDESAATVRELEKPKPLSIWAHAWTSFVPPAESQTPRFVPLGGAARDPRWDVRLTGSTSALVPLATRGSNLVRAEIQARVHARPFDAPAAFDADVAVQRWFDPNLARRTGSEGRPPVYVRELLASYASSGYYGGIGRMRYAASTVGMLDGLRVSAPLGAGVSLGAFGGLLPDPLSGAPAIASNRFGVETAFSRPDTELRPAAALVVQGSTFQGKLDERRLSGFVSLFPGSSRLGAHFQVSGFDKGNPWNAKAIELTAVGLDSSVRAGVFEFGGRFDAAQPERSLFLASYLPASYLCVTVPSSPGFPPGPERCNGSVSTLAIGTVDAGVDLDPVSLFVGATRSGDLTQSGMPSGLSVFASGRVVRIARVLRIEASGDYSTATYMDMFGGGAGPGLTFFDDALDLSLHYRETTLRYRTPTTSLIEHAVGGTVVVLPDPTLLVAVQGEAMTGDDVKALMLFGTMTWHPSL